MRIAIIGAGSVGATCRTSAKNNNGAHSLLALGLKNGDAFVASARFRGRQEVGARPRGARVWRQLEAARKAQRKAAHKARQRAKAAEQQLSPPEAPVAAPARLPSLPGGSYLATAVDEFV